MEARISRTANSVPEMFSRNSSSAAVNGASSRRTDMPVQKASCTLRAACAVCTLTICTPSIASTTGEYAPATIDTPEAISCGICRPSARRSRARTAA
ncbi:hypothetical protein D3C75_936920 [compost metagenome]